MDATKACKKALKKRKKKYEDKRANTGKKHKKSKKVQMEKQ